MTPTRAVLFDVGGTLVEEPGIGLGARLGTALGLDPAETATITSFVLENAFTSAADLAERLRAKLGRADELTPVVRELWDAERDGFVEIPDARTCVAAVGNAAAKIGILADLPSPGVEGFRIACPAIVPWIEVWTLSSEHGSAKPNAALFEIALAALGVSPAAALMVGDSLERDVVPALALGMSAIWLRRHESGAGPVVTIDPHAATFPIPAAVVPEGALVARTLSDVRRMALTWLWADRAAGRALTGPLVHSKISEESR